MTNRQMIFNLLEVIEISKHQMLRKHFDKVYSNTMAVILDLQIDKTCENCKFYNKRDNICNKPDITMVLPTNFGCNLFEYKKD